LTGDLWKSRFASLHLVNAVFMFVQDLGIVNVREVSRTVIDRDRNECTLRAVFTRDFGEILRHARDYSRCMVQLMRYTLTIDLNIWEIKENQASVNEFALHQLPNWRSRKGVEELLFDFYDGNDHDLLLIVVQPSENSNSVELMNDIRQVVDEAEADQKLQNVNDGDDTMIAHLKSVLIVLVPSSLGREVALCIVPLFGVF
jgi:hypothetical protein